MTLLISDANILIDFDVGGLIRSMFQLPEDFAVPNTLYEEELIEHHAELPGYGLRALDVQEEFVLEAYRLGGVYRKPSHLDLLALALAKQEECPLLTGDYNLRLAAIDEQVEVHGTLWLMERMMEIGIVTVERAEQAYEAMKNDQRRLPWDMVKQQLDRFRKSE